MDLSKTYDFLSHDLLIANLEAYGLDVVSLNFHLDYLSLRKHRTKVGSSYIKWSGICRGIQQGKIKNQKLVISFMTMLYIDVEKFFLKLKGIWYIPWKHIKMI